MKAGPPPRAIPANGMPAPGAVPAICCCDGVPAPGAPGDSPSNALNEASSSPGSGMPASQSNGNCATSAGQPGLRFGGERRQRQLAGEPLHEVGFVEKSALGDGLLKRRRQRFDRRHRRALYGLGSLGSLGGLRSLSGWGRQGGLRAAGRGRGSSPRWSHSAPHPGDRGPAADRRLPRGSRAARP